MTQEHCYLIEDDNIVQSLQKGRENYFINHKYKIMNKSIMYVLWGKWELNLTHDCQIMV